MLKNYYWPIPSRVVVMQYAGYVTVDDFVQGADQLRAIINSLPQDTTLHNIIDGTEQEAVDPELRKINVLQGIVADILAHPRMGWTVLVDPNPNKIGRFMTLLFMRIMRKQLYIASTVDDAIQFLYEEDPSL